MSADSALSHKGRSNTNSCHNIPLLVYFFWYQKLQYEQSSGTYPVLLTDMQDDTTVRGCA